MDDLLDLQAAVNAGATYVYPDPLSAAEFERADVNGDCIAAPNDLATLSAQMNDPGGSPHTIFTWDAENRLIEVRPAAPGVAAGSRVRFLYDYRGRRVGGLLATRERGPNLAARGLLRPIGPDLRGSTTRTATDTKKSLRPRATFVRGPSGSL